MNLSTLTGETRRNGIAFAALALLLIVFVFGGASQRHELRLAVVELAALPLLVLTLSEMIRSGVKLSPLALSLLVGLSALPLVQLIPLPASLWASLPGRDQAALAIELAGIGPAWVPLSLAPEETWRSFLALLPSVAMVCGVTICGAAFRLRSVQLILIFALASLIVAGAQTILGGSALHLWPSTNRDTVVGLFANRNHFATLCVLSLPFAAVLGARSLRHLHSDQRMFWFSILFVGSTILALAVIRSRMGLVLAIPSLGTSVLAAWIASGRGRPQPLHFAVIGGLVLTVAAVALIVLPPVLERFDNSGPQEGRFENWPTVLDAAGSYLPFGSGIGSFDAVYRSVEPLTRLDENYFNQAHNDYLETWLETGWFGMGLVIVFLAWFARRSWAAWRAAISTERDLQRAASIAIGVVLLHSIVDYPLRTETIAVIFALCCAILDSASRPDELTATDRTRARKRRRIA